jgi:hypothetical protein
MRATHRRERPDRQPALSRRTLLVTLATGSVVLAVRSAPATPDAQGYGTGGYGDGEFGGAEQP